MKVTLHMNTLIVYINILTLTNYIANYTTNNYTTANYTMANYTTTNYTNHTTANYTNYIATCTKDSPYLNHSHAWL